MYTIGNLQPDDI